MLGQDENLAQSNGLPLLPGSLQADLLEAIEAPAITVKKKHLLWQAGSEPSMLYMLQSGWAYTYQARDGKPANVIDVFIPGDLMGIRDASLPRHTTTAAMLTDGTVSALTKHQLQRLFERSPALAMEIHSHAVRQQEVLTNRLVSVLGNDARCRIAHFIVEIYSRLKEVYRHVGTDFTFPLLQKHISLALGLTHVHVSRLLKELEEQGIIRKTRRYLEVLDMERLAEMARYPLDATTDTDMGNALHVQSMARDQQVGVSAQKTQA